MVDAAQLCEQMGVPHHVVDSREIFEKYIIKYLVDGYSQGITPLPCSNCNKAVKFRPMIDWAKAERGIDLIAVDSPSAFQDNTPTAKLVRQVLGAIAEFDKAMTVAKLRGARDRKRKAWASARAGSRWRNYTRMWCARPNAWVVPAL